MRHTVHHQRMRPHDQRSDLGSPRHARGSQPLPRARDLPAIPAWLLDLGPADILQLQRRVGNQAVLEVLNGDHRLDAATLHPPTGHLIVQRSIAETLTSWYVDSTDEDTWTLTINANTDDRVGHAWLGLDENRGAGRSTTCGFGPGETRR
jgi:hypothetical protein